MAVFKFSGEAEEQRAMRFPPWSVLVLLDLMSVFYGKTKTCW